MPREAKRKHEEVADLLNHNASYLVDKVLQSECEMAADNKILGQFDPIEVQQDEVERG